ncbi:MAG: hypothetical protein WAN35_09655 [Terracidiphilus sp.]
MIGSAFTHEKTRSAWSPAGLMLLDLSGRLHQAIAVRRHGVSMMMMVTEMAVALHLIQTIRHDGAICQIPFSRFKWMGEGFYKL